MGLVGGPRAAPAKVAVFSSALMGTISGSGVANVVTVGQFTIPLMKRFGYKPSFAGGVEATASMGGQIMPPVMGAVAFIMAENIGVPYSEIVKAAIIPAILYFGSAFWMVHLEAGKHGLLGMPRSKLPSPLAALKRQWHLALPLAAARVSAVHGFTPLFAGSVGLALTVMHDPRRAASRWASAPPALRVAFWIGLGLRSRAAFLQLRRRASSLAHRALLLVLGDSRSSRGGRETLVMCRDALADGARQALAGRARLRDRRHRHRHA